MKFSDKILSQTVVKLCADKGINHIVISPGSRNAPLTIGFGESSDFRCFSIVDERSAAFFALGMAQQLQAPVAVVCTSGSALLNYYPAVAEAFYSDVPLVVISADRPADYIDIGDGQTIRQENVFANHILYSANCKEGKAFQTDNETLINVALNSAIEFKGPVHINIPFSEPLYRTTAENLVVPQNVGSQEPKFDCDIDLQPYAAEWNGSKKKMILVGTLPPDSIPARLLDQLAADPSVLILTECTSNLFHDRTVHSIDQLIAPLTHLDFERLQPDILLTFGGMVVSKKIKSFLRNFPPRAHWHVDIKKAYDTYFVLKEHFKCEINSFLKDFLPLTTQNDSSYRNSWLETKQYRRMRHSEYLDEIPYSDFMVFSEIFSKMPPDLLLQLSNSATIRYAQLFDVPASTQIFCNRGTSGIDGSTSTAVGASVISSRPTLLLTGDLSFLYDSNGLWNNYIPHNFKIIVINNGGGGIFRILPGEKDSPLFDRFFETKHHLNAEYLAKMFGFTYNSISAADELKPGLDSFFNSAEGPSLLEIFTPSTINDQVLQEYFRFIS